MMTAERLIETRRALRRLAVSRYRWFCADCYLDADDLTQEALLRIAYARPPENEQHYWPWVSVVARRAFTSARFRARARSGIAAAVEITDAMLLDGALRAHGTAQRGRLIAQRARFALQSTDDPVRKELAHIVADPERYWAWVHSVFAAPRHPSISTLARYLGATRARTVQAIRWLRETFADIVANKDTYEVGGGRNDDDGNRVDDGMSHAARQAGVVGGHGGGAVRPVAGGVAQI